MTVVVPWILIVDRCFWTISLILTMLCEVGIIFPIWWLRKYSHRLHLLPLSSKLFMELNSWGEFSFFVDILSASWCLYYLMSEYATLLILAMMTGFTMAAGSRLNTENSFEFCYWNMFNQMRYTFECVRVVGAAIRHHGFSRLSYCPT